MRSPAIKDTLRSMTGPVVLGLTLGLMQMAMAPIASAAEPAADAAPSARSTATPRFDPRSRDYRQVEMFSAIASGEIEVQFIPKSSKQANVLITNKAGEPLTVKLPEAFAGVPIHAQLGGMGGMGGMGGGGMGGMGGMGGGGGGGQGMGGGMGGMGGGGMGGMGGGGMGGGGMFNVPAEKVAKLKVPCVCLEHGKPEPSPRMKYRIVPLEAFNKNPQVAEICKMLGRGQIPQNAAQAAAWHLTDELSWPQLAAKDRVRLLNGYTEKYFSPRELVFAMRVVQEAARRAELNASPATKENSLSNR